MKTTNKPIEVPKKRIFIDYDGTLNNTIKQICDLCLADYNIYVPWTEIFTWDFEELNLPKDIKNAYFEDERMFKAISYMDNAFEVITLLCQLGYEVYIVTLGTTLNLQMKEHLLSRALPNVKFIGLDFLEYDDKSSVDMSNGILIDDVDKYLQSSNADIKVCFGETYPWNEDTKHTRCNNWYDFLSIVINDYVKTMKILKEKEDIEK